MILSVSRRTDVPACYPEWFMNRLREGFVLVRNPMNPHQVSRIVLSPEVVDCIVFWTKNPAPMLPHLPEIERRGYPCLFQVTLNAYDSEAEANLPPVEERIATVQTLAGRIGKARVAWRYDPILLSEKYTVDWHIRRFEALAGQLQSCTERCIISYLDVYPKIRSRLREHALRACTEEEMRRIAAAFAEIAQSRNMRLQTCAEQIDLAEFGVAHGACIDGDWISSALGLPLDVRRDPNQRGRCGCVASIDVGAYNTCRNGCVYCYANHSPEAVARNAARHRPDSPLLTGELTPDDRVTERKCLSHRDPSGQQLSML